MIEAYLKHQSERSKQGIPPLPLTAEQTTELCKLLVKPPKGQEELLLSLITDRVSPGVDPAAQVKAAFLADIVTGKTSSPLINAKNAIILLGTMVGGYNIAPLVAALQISELAQEAANALSIKITLVYDAFDEIAALAKNGCKPAQTVISSWAQAEWFTTRQGVADCYKLKAYKVDGEINTEDRKSVV